MATCEWCQITGIVPTKCHLFVYGKICSECIEIFRIEDTCLLCIRGKSDSHIILRSLYEKGLVLSYHENIIKDIFPSFKYTKSSFLDVKHTPHRTKECSRCTYLNNVQRKLCEMCNSHLVVPSLEVKSSKNPNEVFCSQCTFLNPKTATHCQICQNTLPMNTKYIDDDTGVETCALWEFVVRLFS